jgi:2-methylcitrate dehydratase PrpD
VGQRRAFRRLQHRRPATGLEAKFSLRFTVAMALAGEDTADIGCSPTR